MTVKELVNQINILAENKLIDIDKDIFIHNLEDGETLEICGVAYFDYGGIDLQALKYKDDEDK